MSSRGRVVAAWVVGLLLAGALTAAAVPVPNPDPCAITGSVSTAKLAAYTKCRLDRIEAAVPGNETVTVTVTAPPVTVTVTETPAPTSTEPPATTPESSEPVTSSAPATTASTATSEPPAPSGFPDASNTGVPTGTVLTAYTGPTTITTAGTVIDSKRITGCIVIEANNVTIKNSLLQTNGCFFNVLSDNGNTGLQLTDVEVDGQGNSTGDSAVNGGGYTCLRCNIHGTVDGFKAGIGVVIQDTWIHDLVVQGDSHNDGIQSLGTTSLKILHNSIIVADGATAAVILSTGSADAMKNVLIDGNLLGGGAFTVYGGYEAGRDVLSKVSNISVTNNKFTTVIHPRSGAYGPLTSVDPPVTVSGNVWADGPNAGAPVS